MAVGGAGFLVTNMQLRWDIKRSSSAQKIEFWRHDDVITFIFSNLFPKFRAFIITFQNGLYGTSSVVFLTFKVLYIQLIPIAFQKVNRAFFSFGCPATQDHKLNFEKQDILSDF